MQTIPFATKIPKDVKEELQKYCKSKGLKINFFITQAIQEKLAAIREEMEDLQTFADRAHEESIPYEKARKMLGLK